MIIVATGWKEYGRTGYLGYNSSNVITQMRVERLLAPNGPLVGHVKDLQTEPVPRILFINVLVHVILIVILGVPGNMLFNFIEKRKTH